VHRHHANWCSGFVNGIEMRHAYQRRHRPLAVHIADIPDRIQAHGRGACLPQRQLHETRPGTFVAGGSGRLRQQDLLVECPAPVRYRGVGER
jgi:hypothetical protein